MNNKKGFEMKYTEKRGIWEIFTNGLKWEAIKENIISMIIFSIQESGEYPDSIIAEIDGQVMELYLKESTHENIQ